MFTNVPTPEAVQALPEKVVSPSIVIACPIIECPGGRLTPENACAAAPVYAPEIATEPVPERSTNTEATDDAPKLTPWPDVELAAPAGLEESEDAAPPPIVMSAPNPEVVELSSVKSPKVTPPLAPLVFDQNVIGPLAVLKSLGVPLNPALPVMRPTDFTRIP